MTLLDSAIALTELSHLQASPAGRSALAELVGAARAYVGFSFAEEERIAETYGRTVSSAPFVRVEQRLRHAVRAVDELLGILPTSGDPAPVGVPSPDPPEVCPTGGPNGCDSDGCPVCAVDPAWPWSTQR